MDWWAQVGMTGDERGWGWMGTGGGRGWTRVLELVIIALSGKKEEKKKTYLMNWASVWQSVDVRGGGSGC